jgi:hypothetical protein
MKIPSFGLRYSSMKKIFSRVRKKPGRDMWVLLEVPA